MNIFGLLGAIGLSFVSGFTPSVKKNAVNTSNDGVFEHVYITDTYDYSIYDNFVSSTSSDTSNLKMQSHTIIHYAYGSDFTDSYYTSNIYYDVGNYYFDVWYNEHLSALLITDSEDNDILADFKYACVSTILLEHYYRSSRHTYRIHRFDYVIFGNELLQSPTQYYLNPYIFYIDNLGLVNTENNLLIRNTYCNNNAPDEYQYFTINYTYSFGDYPVNPVYQMTNNMLTRYLYGGISNGYYSSVSQVNNYYHTLPKDLVYETASNSRGAYKSLVVDYKFNFAYRSYDNSDSAYNRGYNSGFADGYSAGEDTGYTDGYSAGDSNGYTRGYNTGYATGVSTTEHSFTNLFSSIADVPILIIRNMFNFDFFGVNLLGVVLSLFSVFLLLWIFRKLIK